MSRSSWLGHAFLGFAAYCVCNTASAAQWSMQPTVQLYFDHASNRLLQPVDEENNDAAWLTIDALLKRASETGELDVHPEIQIQRFSGDTPLNSNNGSLQLSALNNGEIYSYTASATYADRSTLISELENTGIIDASARQEAATVNLAGADQFTERQRLGLQASYSDVKYPDGERVGLIGFRDPAISTTYTYGLSPETSLSASVFGSRVTAPENGFTSRDVGARFAWAYILSPTTNISASAGISNAHIESQEFTGSVWTLQGTHNSELTQWTFSFTRDVVPSGFGLLYRRDEIDLSLIHRIAQHLDATLSAIAAHNSDLVTGFSGDNRRYFSGVAGIDWHTSPQWILSLKVRASEARVPNEVARLELASGWQSILKLTWTPLPWTKSR
jgi:hypothetical protein